jgi:hypothetical protein
MKSIAIFCLVATALAAPAKMAAAPRANCTMVQTQLEKGIQANLDIQAQELKGYIDLLSLHFFTLLTSYTVSSP